MKMLFIADFDITRHINNGGAKICERNYKALQQIFGKENIDLCIISSRKIENQKCIEGRICGIRKHINNIFGYSYLTYRGYVQLKRLLRTNKDYKWVWVDSIEFGKCLKIKKRIKNIKAAVFAQNVETELVKYTFSIANFKLYRLFKWWGVWINERSAVKWADKFICISRLDAEIFKKKYRREADFLYPVTLEDTYKGIPSIPIPAGRYILFVGSYFKPNIEAVLWLNDNIAPLIGCDIMIVGKDMERLHSDGVSFRENVHCVGTAEDLSSYYHGALAVVLPVFSGAGMKVKTAESLMYGKRIIASDVALEGYDIDDLLQVYRCNTRDEYLSAIAAAIKEPLLFSPQVRERFLRDYEQSRNIEKLGKLFYADEAYFKN